MKVEVIPLKLPLIKEGDNLAELITREIELENGDVVAICSTVVSKAEGRRVKLSEFKPTEIARRLAEKVGREPEFVQAVIDES